MWWLCYRFSLIQKKKKKKQSLYSIVEFIIISLKPAQNKSSIQDLYHLGKHKGLSCAIKTTQRIESFDRAATHWADEWRSNPLQISDSSPHTPITGRHSNDRIIGWEAPFLKHRPRAKELKTDERGGKKGGVEGRPQTWIIPLENLIQLLSGVSTLAAANQRPRQLLYALVRTEVLGWSEQQGRHVYMLLSFTQ